MRFSAALFAMSLTAVEASAPPALRIALTLDPQLPPSVAGLAVEEAAAIWRPYGISVEASPYPNPDPSIRPLTVRIQPETPNLPSRTTAFAAIQFLNGEPQPTLLLYYKAITSLARRPAEVGISASDWPQALRDQIAARVAGRALAHEIGHWVLQSRTHSVVGLMRAAHPTTHLMAAHRRPFRLAPEDVERLGDAVRLLMGAR